MVLSSCQARRPCSTWKQLEDQLLLLTQTHGTGWGTLSRSSPSSTGPWPVSLSLSDQVCRQVLLLPGVLEELEDLEPHRRRQVGCEMEADSV